jgi:hypothetical protein
LARSKKRREQSSTLGCVREKGRREGGREMEEMRESRNPL